MCRWSDSLATMSSASGLSKKSDKSRMTADKSRFMSSYQMILTFDCARR
jgi:hypothetical protein